MSEIYAASNTQYSASLSLDVTNRKINFSINTNSTNETSGPNIIDILVESNLEKQLVNTSKGKTESKLE